MSDTTTHFDRKMTIFDIVELLQRFRSDMRILCGCILLFIEAAVFGQGFNERYDAFGWGNGQGALGIETTEEGWAVISTSYDVDSIAPDFYLTHASVIFTFIDTEGNKVAERRTYRPLHGT